ncbi:S8 family peptidase [Nocardioides sp. LMS-CY]|uniref:S8 family peptidase n=1 Tax=Nocardioides sp. (strain LMS-CY) TaxID=2840457 RepID=UPI001C0055B7|nr:S8 family peptidase [Nocardioides sp. LMS-CY]QWF23666.1 S8 family peptidase [Nocardioides sp. LMS-CY]
MSEQLSLIEPQRHTHLRLAAATDPGPRRTRTPGRGGAPAYTDRERHAEDLGRQVSTIADEHRRRSEVLGVDPELILVLEINGPLDPADVERAGLRVLELRSDRALVAFAQDPELTEFVRRNDLYMQGTRGFTDKGYERAAEYETLFDKIDALRPIGSRDLIGVELARHLDEGPDPGEVVRLEINCWCSEDAGEAQRRNADVAAAVGRAGGTVHATSVRATAGWSVVCCDLPVGMLEEVLATDRISWVDLMPSPMLDAPEFLSATPESLPLAVAPSSTAPILAVIDSGIRSAHPLLAPAVIAAEAVGEGIADGGDESGHGTLVASLGLYGSLEEPLATRSPVVPAGRLLSVRVLDRNDRFPDDQAWPDLLLEAMTVAAEAGARVINLSLGDSRRPYAGPRPTPIAAMVDQFIRYHQDVVVVTCAGNYDSGQHDLGRLRSNDYVADLLTLPEPGILDPGTAALSLTVGGLGGGHHQGVFVRASADKVVVGGPNLPSPHTRVGPGPMGAIKPELSAPSGSAVVDTVVGREDRGSTLGKVVGAGGNAPDRLLAAGRGTSYAAPLVSHGALRVLGQYPELNGNSVRALLLVGADQIPTYLDSGAPARQDERRLTGYGRVSPERSEMSDDHRVVLLSQHTIRVNQAHFYRVAIPSSFRVAGGRIDLSVALAFDPPVRVTRLDYLASKMSFQAFHGPSLEEVRLAYVKAATEEDLEDDVALTPSGLRGRLDLQPADTERSRGANQLGRYVRHQKVADDRPDELVIAVRNQNRWDVDNAEQRYSLAVMLQRDTGHPSIYAELRAELEPLVEIEIEAEAGF